MNEKKNETKRHGLFDFAMKHPIISFLIADEIVTLIHNIAAMHYNDVNFLKEVKKGVVRSGFDKVRDAMEKYEEKKHEENEVDESDEDDDSDGPILYADSFFD